MAYDTSSPPKMVASRLDGDTPSIWVFETTDPLATVLGDDYVSDATLLGMRVGDHVVISETDNAYSPAVATVSAISSGAATLSRADKMATEGGPGIDGIAETHATSVVRRGGIIETQIIVDLTGLNSSAAADIIGDDGTGAAYIGQITAARNGTIFGGTVKCIETPATGEPDIDLYSATEATGVEDTAITDLTETALLDAAADWTNLLAAKGLTAVPAADEYLYLVGSGGGTDATYTAGKLVITLWGT